MPKFIEVSQHELPVPQIRCRSLNEQPIAEQGDYVLYWMVAYRRADWNFSLQRAIEWATDLGKPIVVLEALRAGYKWASDRLHHFVVQGMADNQKRFADLPVHYYPYLEPEAGAGKGLLEALAKNACVVVSDDFPCFFLPRMQQVAAKKIDVRLEVIDSNGLLPMRAAEKVYARAYDLRRFIQKELPNHLGNFPQQHPFQGRRLEELKQLPSKITKKWPAADVVKLAENPADLADFPIDHNVPPVESIAGGAVAAEACLHDFLNNKLQRYGDERNQPERDAPSGLSPYLHFGHISAHQVFAELAEQENWEPDQLGDKANGARSGWWGASETVEGFLDELITWRELGFNMCSKQDDYARYSSLPGWAQETLAEHASDEREHLYTLKEFEQAETHDELWNAAQRQLLVEGRIHNYLRMLWGKKILEWTESPQEALEVMLELNNKYALDGRNPNSYSGIFWVLGRYDRAWGPERPVYGKIRYMSSENTARKVKVKGYIEQYSSDSISQRSLFD